MLQRGLANADDSRPAATTATATAAAAAAASTSIAAASSPLSAMKLFQQPSEATHANNTASQSNSNSNNSTLFPKTSQTSFLSAQLFSLSSGIDTTNLQQLLNKKRSRGGDDTKQWELRKRLEHKEEEVIMLRTALQDLLEGKNQYVSGAIAIELGLRSKMLQAQRVHDKLGQENGELAQELEEESDEHEKLKEKVQELIRERDSYMTKCEMLTSEVDSAKVEVGKLQQINTENAVSLGVVKEKVLAQVSNLEAAKIEAVKEAEAKISMEMGETISQLQVENEKLAIRVKVGRVNKEEIYRMMGVEVHLVDDVSAAIENDDGVDGIVDCGGNGTANSLFFNAIKQRLGEYQKDLKVKEEVEKSLESCMKELEKVEADYQAALDTITTKERDMTELMKSIGDIQRSGQDREQEIVNQCKAAVSRATAAESGIVECREKLLSLGYEKKSLEEALENDLKVKEEAQKSLESCMEELEKVKANYQAALETIATRDRDVTELMKSVGDIQRSSQDREQEVANQCKAAVDRATAAECQIVECREKLLSLGYEKKSLEEALDSCNAECGDHETTITNLQQEISNSKIETVQHDSQLQLERDLRSKAEEKEHDERAERVALAAQLNAQLQEHAKLERQLRESMESVERTLTEQIRLKEEESKMKDAEADKCKETITALEAHQLSLKQSLSEQKSMMDASKEEEIGRLKGEIANLESKIKSEAEKMQCAGVVTEAKACELEKIIENGKVERKRMHNLIQELRGNVRVFARIRPFLPDDGEQCEVAETPSVSYQGDAIVSVAKQNDPSQRHKFPFDRVFAPSAGQETVYEEVSEFVQSSLDGYNVCLFSYGQTGSGKTHTMQGTGNGVMRGLIPRSIEQIGNHKNRLEKDGWTFSLEVSFLEIYNEALRDLLRDNLKEESKHEIKVGSDGRRTVTNLTVRPIDPNDQEAVEAVLALASKRRSTASTDMNATSSRSHSVFTLNITAMHEEQKTMVRGTLNLVDLAGSERLDRSNVAGQHAKEAMAINKSLSSLADVFTAIGNKASHIPFRNSRLTYLLQPALSGDGKTCMVVNISPTERSVQESLCSLRFASKVNKCELGKAKRTIEEVKTGVTKRGSITGSKSSSASRNVKRKM